MNKTTEPAALVGIEQQLTDWMRREMPAGTVIGDPDWWVPRILKAATVERLVQERNQWGAKLLREMADEYAHGAKDADKDSRVFLSEANARCAIHLRRKADELEEGKGNG